MNRKICRIAIKNFLGQPDPPQDLIAYNSTAQSVMLHWKRPLHLNEAVKYWFTITYKTRYLYIFIYLYDIYIYFTTLVLVFICIEKNKILYVK